MEEFKWKLMKNCNEYGVVPSQALLGELKSKTKTDESSCSGLSLDFSGCNLSVQDCAVLAKTLANDRNITELRFSDCFLTEEACKLLLSAFPSNRGVQKLDFKGNNIRSSAELIGRILKVTTALTHLNLEWNGIGLRDTSISAVSEGLQMNQTLRYLDLRNNQISYEGGTSIANALKANHVLKVLDLRWNNVGMLGAKSFLSMLKLNREIMKVELSGNNIPSEMMKAIEYSLQRNVELQQSCKEQQVLAATYKQRLESIESEKNTQITSLVDKLACEKENYNSSARSAQEKIEQLKMALDERQSAFATLLEKHAATESSLYLAEQSNRRQEEYIDGIKEENARKQKEMEFSIEKLKEQLAIIEKTHMGVIEVKKNEIAALEKRNKELADEVSKFKYDNEEIRHQMKERDMKHQKLLSETEKVNCEEINNLKAEQNIRKQTDLQRQQKLEQINGRLEEEISQLKSKILSEKLKFEEDMMNMKVSMKQEEMNRNRQFEERIELLQASRNETQIKVTKQNADISDLQNRMSFSERECESLKRQCENLKQQISSKDAELRCGSNKAQLEIDNERKANMQLKAKAADLEMKINEQEKRATESLDNKDVEISYLKNQLASKYDEISRIRNDEIKRTEMLENALQSYLSSARKAR